MTETGSYWGMRVVAILMGIAIVCGCSSDDAGDVPRKDAGSVDVVGPDVVDAKIIDAVADAIGDAPTKDAAPSTPPPGTVTEDGGACDPGTLPGATCKHLTVKCPGIADLGVAVRTARPTKTPVATLLMGSSSAGNVYIEDESPAALVLENEMLAAGYVIVSRKWDDPGWFSGGATGLHALSCRYATLLKWVDENLREKSAPYCALGNSGGSYELGYALTRWDAADRLKGALLLAGPAVSRLDWVCPSSAPQTWIDTDCPALAAKHGVSCTQALYCTVIGGAAVVDQAWTPNHPCTDSNDPLVPKLADDGIVTDTSRYDYPNTALRFVAGADECGVQSLLWYDRITSDRGIAHPEGTGHAVLDTDAGVSATRTAIQQACAAF